MSVLVTLKVAGNTATFQDAVTNRADEFAEIGARSRAEGAIHHRFGVGDGFVVVVDEWETPEQFEKFFGNPELQAFIGTIGGDTTAAPEITITQAITSADEF
jgi:quinol monooxygenase YgiN